MSRCTSSKPQADSDVKFCPSSSLVKSTRAIQSSASLRTHRQTIMVPFPDDQRPSTSECHSNLTAGPSRASSSRHPAGHGAAGLNLSTSKPALVGLHDQLASSTIAISEDQKELYEEHIWFLRIVILQGLPGFLFLRRQLGASANWPSRNNFLAMFDLMAPKLIAYRAKYDVEELPVWAATFLLQLQELCEKVFEADLVTLARHWRDWFFKESKLIQCAFIGEERPLQLYNAICTPQKFLEAKFLNFIQFKISYSETLLEVPQGHHFPQKILYKTQWMVTIPPDNQPYAFHRYPADSSRFDPANDPLDDNCCFRDITPPLVKAPTRDSSPSMSLGKLHPSLFMGPRGLEPTPIGPWLAYSTTNMKIPDIDGFPKLKGGRVNTSLFDYDSIFTQGGADPEKRKDPSQVEKRSNKKGEAVLMLPRPATKGVAMITEKFARPGEFQDNECVCLHVNFNSLIGSMVPLQTFPLTSPTLTVQSVIHAGSRMPPACSPFLCQLFANSIFHYLAIGVDSAALCKENTALHCQGHLVCAMVTEYYIQAENIFRRQKHLQNLTTSPRALLQGLIQDGFVEKDNIERLSLLAFLLGWEKWLLLGSFALSISHGSSGAAHGPLGASNGSNTCQEVDFQVQAANVLSTFHPLPSSEKSSDLGNEGPPSDKAASEEESDDRAVVRGSEADASGESDSEAEEDEDSNEEADEEVDNDDCGPPSQVEEEDAVIEIAESQHESRAPTPILKHTRSVNEEELSDGPAPAKRVRMPSRKQGRVTSAPQVALDSSADIIPPKQLAKQSKTAGPSQMRVVVPQTTTAQLCPKLFQKPKMHQAEGSSSKTKRK
ncbi:hypothetical protein BT96DRAFT_1007828 [Gymnopus androsaceus JB14]|uniref:Uncharacterized protein n=1 Tax=Gymnopus androsaceus JB14 TaxID=1447944 RepID=A0A6A4GGN7_9AGAR|nr:hypothetical protein BT96DRAFT_1007828 [Gymnopus androsaceus JB14]